MYLFIIFYFKNFIKYYFKFFKYIYRSAKYLFLWKVLQKKPLNIFSNFFFYLKLQTFQSIMENNFIQMSASAGHAVTYTIGSICKLIIDCVQLYFTSGFTNIVLLSVNCLWLVGVTLFFDRHPTNNSPTVSNRSTEVVKRHQLCG